MTRTACALTGHRAVPDTFDGNALYDKLEELIQGGCDTFFCGMAKGFDLLALGCLVDLKKKYNIYIEACIPFAGQEKGYTERDRKRYRSMLEWCDRKTVLFEEYQSGCYHARDRYMVDCADTVLAYCVKDTGGTAYTVKYAKEKNIPVIYL